MKFDKTTIIGLIVCAVLLFTWEPVCRRLGWLPPLPEETLQQQNKTENPAPAQAAIPAAEVKNDATPQSAEEAKTAPENAKEEVAQIIPADEVIRNDHIVLTISGKNGAISEISFPKFKHNDKENDITIGNCALFDLIIPDAVIGASVFSAKSDKSISVTNPVTTSTGGLVALTRTYTIKDDYIINCRYSFNALGATPVVLKKVVFKGGSMAPWHTFSGDEVRTISHRLDYFTDAGEHEDIDGDEDDEDFYIPAKLQVQWFSLNNKYFCSVFKSTDGKSFAMWQENPRPKVTDARNKEHYVLTAGAEVPEITIIPGAEVNFDFSSYTGPKSSDALSRFVPNGEDSMHLAWGPLNYLARLLMWLLNFFYSICGSYGWSIILLTILVRTAFYPLTSKGNESMRKMQKVQPLFKELKEKYKNDPQLLNQKMTELYRKEGINPLAGCLPVLLQIPIFFALYAMLDNAIALRHESFLWAKNLAAAVKPPVSAPRYPVSLTASRTPRAIAPPKPKSGTVTPEPKISFSGSKRPTAPRKTPDVT